MWSQQFKAWTNSKVHHAAQLSETELELAEQLPKLISKLKEDETKGMLNKIRWVLLVCHKNKWLDFWRQLVG